LKIIVIDDEDLLREVICEYLKMEGHEVIEADNGSIGLKLIKASPPDLIICDVRMPDMNGDELFNTLKQTNSALSVIPFIFLSGHLNEQEIISRLNLGANNCFVKPINLKLLAAYVNSQLLGINRLTSFFESKLIKISSSISTPIQSDIIDYSSLLTKLCEYTTAIISQIDAFKPSSPTNSIMTRHAYVNFFLIEYKKRKDVAKTTNGEDLSWILIFSVAKAQLEGWKVPVSDLYLETDSAKSTINNRINGLIKDGIIEKNDDSKDGRRLLVSLTEQFNDKLITHIDHCIELIGNELQCN